MGNDKQQALNHEQYKELQELLKNLGISAKCLPLNDAEENQASQVFLD